MGNQRQPHQYEPESLILLRPTHHLILRNPRIKRSATEGIGIGMQEKTVIPAILSARVREKAGVLGKTVTKLPMMDNHKLRGE
jgi:hypothetical protein